MLKFREIGVFLKKPSRDPVGTQSGPNRAPILAFLGTAFGQSGSSRAPIFEFLAPRLDLSGSSRITQKRAKTLQKCYFWARTHSHTYFSLPRPTLAPIFLFRAPAVHQYPPPLLHQNGKSSLKPNGGSTSNTLFFVKKQYLCKLWGIPLKDAKFLSQSAVFRYPFKEAMILHHMQRVFVRSGARISTCSIRVNKGNAMHSLKRCAFPQRKLFCLPAAIILPVVLRKAVGEVSKIGHNRKGELL